MEDKEYAEYRRRRVNRLKKIIVCTIGMAILIPVIVAIVFAVLFVRTNSELKSLRNQYNELLETIDRLGDEQTESIDKQDVYSVSPVVESERDTAGEDDEASEEAKSEDSLRHIYLTFDDGPSSSTGQILDILKEYDVKATFFVTGKTDEESVQSYKRIVDEGHTLGMHSYSHRYSQIYESKEAFSEDLTTLQEYLYDCTGVWSRYYRFPGGSSNTTANVDMDVLIEYLDEQDITYFDWNVASGDAVSYTLSADRIVQNCISGTEGMSDIVILMHDAQARKTTVEALPMVIEYYQGLEDTAILPIGDDTVPIQHRVIKN